MQVGMIRSMYRWYAQRSIFKCSSLWGNTHILEATHNEGRNAKNDVTESLNRINQKRKRRIKFIYNMNYKPSKKARSCAESPLSEAEDMVVGTGTIGVIDGVDARGVGALGGTGIAKLAAKFDVKVIDGCGMAGFEGGGSRDALLLVDGGGGNFHVALEGGGVGLLTGGGGSLGSSAALLCAPEKRP